MAHKDVQQTINPIVPCCHMAWTVGNAPKLPWAVFYLDENDGQYADNKRYAEVNHWVVELYEKTHSCEVESAVEEAITEKFGAFSKTEIWVESESCIQVVYRFTEI